MSANLCCEVQQWFSAQLLQFLMVLGDEHALQLLQVALFESCCLQLLNVSTAAVQAVSQQQWGGVYTPGSITA